MTALVEMEGWKTAEGKATQKKKKSAAADKKRVKEMHDNTPMMKNSGWGKNSYQL
jgi:hypothetical protein